MATATVEITLPGYTGLALSLDLYPLGSDTIAATIASLTEATNRKCTYTGTTTAGLTGVHLAVAKEGSTVRGEGYVPMTDTANVHIVGIDLPGKVLGGGSGTISGVGARAVDGDGDAVAKASAVAALGSSVGPNQVNVTVSSSAGGTVQGVSVRMRAAGLGDHTAITNASGVATFNLASGSWSLTAALNGYSYAGSTQVVSTNPQAIAITMTATSVSVPSSPNKSVGALLCLDSLGDPESGVTVSFQMVAGPGNDGYSLDAEIVEEECDSEGILEREFLRGATYDAWRGVRGARVRFVVPDAASFDLPEHLGVD